MTRKFAMNENKEFWNNYAKKSKDAKKGAHSDPFLVELENNFIKNILEKNHFQSCLDIGCGNGRRTIFFSQFVKIIKGIDYSDEMIKHATNYLKNQKNDIKNKVSFETADIQKWNEESKYDVVISCRCIINQNSTKKQLELIQKIHKSLKKNGMLILAEGSHEGYQKLNLLRKKFKLEPISISKINFPIRERSLFPKIKELFEFKKIERLGNYYFISRIIHPLLAHPQKPKPESKVNEIASLIESKMNEKFDVNYSENFGAHLLINLKKK
jgi:SAM-dependent methyltransferase